MLLGNYVNFKNRNLKSRGSENLKHVRVHIHNKQHRFLFAKQVTTSAPIKSVARLCVDCFSLDLIQRLGRNTFILQDGSSSVVDSHWSN